GRRAPVEPRDRSCEPQCRLGRRPCASQHLIEQLLLARVLRFETRREKCQQRRRKIEIREEPVRRRAAPEREEVLRRRHSAGSRSKLPRRAIGPRSTTTRYRLPSTIRT